MANFDELKQIVEENIRPNYNEEITGQILQGVLLEAIDEINEKKADAGSGPGPVPSLDGAVRYDETQDLTDTEKQTARINIGSASYGDIEDIEGLIPSQASIVNQLADKNFVNSTIQTATADFRGNWYNWDSVPVDASEYPEDYKGSHIPTNKDYMVVQNAELYGFSPDIERSWIVGEICVGRLQGDSMAMYYCVNDFDGRAVDSPDSFQILFYTGSYVGNFFDAEEWYEGNICSYNNQFYECTANVDTTLENTPDKDTEHWDFISMNYNNIRFGTWRFKYSGLWAEMGKDGWLPEYQVNETPLTAAQLAAINSGINDDLVKKIEESVIDVREDGVSVVSEGIASLSKRVFFAEYGVTTFNEVRSAYNSGKIVALKRSQWGDDFLGYLNTSTNNWADFVAWLATAGEGSYLRIHLTSANVWSTAEVNLEKTANKVTTLNASSNDTQYPSAKCVYDAINAAGNVFYAVYGTTTYNEVLAAYNAGKVVFVYTDTYVYKAYKKSTTTIYFYALYGSGKIPDTFRTIKLDSSGWGGLDVGTIQLKKLVTSIGPSSTDEQYPSAKATYDAIRPDMNYYDSSLPSTIQPNVLTYVSALDGNVTVTLATIPEAEEFKENEYRLIFNTGDNAPTITWDSSIRAFGGSIAKDGQGKPVILANKHYEFSILGGYAIGIEMDV